MAIEDAAVLGHLLAQASTPAEMEKAFHGYDAVRRARTQKLVATTREASLLWGLQHPDFGDDFEKIRGNIDVRMLWIWEEDLRKEVEMGERVMRGL